MVRWIFDFVSVHAHGPSSAEAQDGCPVCDHPYGGLSHACISSGGATVNSYSVIHAGDPIVAA